MNEGPQKTASGGGAAALVGRVLAGKFRIESTIGAGAMGAVYKARQIALDKVVAVKVLHGQYAEDPTFMARFEREAKAATRVDHPNSMRVLDFGREPDGLLYIAMEFLDGVDLFRLIQDQWPLSASRVVDLLAQALAAVAVAHDLGIVHRDLKPENVMILRGIDDEGRPCDVVKVCDFGIATFTDGRQGGTLGGPKLTSQGLVVGTPEYMSPEQGRGEPLDARSDLYAMGVILYQLLTGRLPFEADTALGIVFKHVTEEPVAPRQVRPEVDARIEAVCLKAMKKRREERYQSAREMRADLRAARPDEDPMVRAPTELPPPPRSALARMPTAPAVEAAPTALAQPQMAAPAAAMAAPSKPTVGPSARPPDATPSVGPLDATADARPLDSIAAAPPIRATGLSTPSPSAMPAQSKPTLDAAVALSEVPTPVRRRGVAIGAALVAFAGVALVAATLGARWSGASRRAMRDTIEEPAGEGPGGRVPSDPVLPGAAPGHAAPAHLPATSESAATELTEPPVHEISAPGSMAASRPPTKEPPSGLRPKGPVHGPLTVPATALGAARPAVEASAPVVAEGAAPIAEHVALVAPSSAPPPLPTPSTPTAASPSAAAPSGPFDASHARVEYTVTSAGGGATIRSVQRAFGHAHGRWTQCYRTALERRGQAIDDQGVLHVTTDDTGQVSTVNADGLDALFHVKQCIVAAAHVRVDGVDTGEAWADVRVELHPQ